MKALTFQGARSVRCETVPDPRIVDPGDALVRVEAAGICGSDLHVYHEREKGIDRGTVMGHELCGEVVETGPAVTSLRKGDRVVSPFTTSCGRCFFCERRLTSRCVEGRLFGWVEKGLGLHGAQAELVRVPLADSTLVPWPEGVPAEEALLLGDVLPTGFYCADRAEVASGGLYVVIGCGPVGLAAILGARDRGAEVVYAIDPIPERRARAERLGARPLDPGAVDPRELVGEIASGRGFDGVLEAVGSPAAARLAFDLLRPGGILASVGVHTATDFPFSPVEAYEKNLTVRSGRCPARAYVERLLPALAARRWDLSHFVSHRLPLAEGPEGYRMFDEKRDGCTKVVLFTELPRRLDEIRREDPPLD